MMATMIVFLGEDLRALAGAPVLRERLGCPVFAVLRDPFTARVVLPFGLEECRGAVRGRDALEAFRLDETLDVGVLRE